MVANERSIVQVGPQALAPAQETDWREVERIFRGMIARNTTDAVIDATIMVCRELGLNPVLKQVDLIDGQVYVNHKGLLAIAHRSGLFDGIAVLEQGETDTHWTARVAIYRKDMAHPFTYRGRYPKTGRNKQYGEEMALVRAETHALRRAFNVSMPIFEEINWQEQPSQGAGLAVREVPPAQLAAPAKPTAPPLPAVGLDEEQFGDFLTGFERMAADGHSPSALRGAMSARAAQLDATQRKFVSDLYLAIVNDRRDGKHWPHPDQQQQPAPIEATVVETPPVEVGPLGQSLDPATERQVKFIFALGLEAGLDGYAVNTLARGMFGGDVDGLNRRDAVLLLEEVRQQKNAGYLRSPEEVAADDTGDEVPF